MLNKIKVSNGIRDFHNDRYKGKSEWRMIGAKGKFANLVSLTRNIPLKKVIDIGCGEGSLLEIMDKNDYAEKLYGVDICKNAIDITKKRRIRHLEFADTYDGYNLPLFGDNFFDLAILSHVLEHVEFLRVLIRTAQRVAKYVFWEIPLEDNFRLPDRLQNVGSFQDAGHINFFSRKTFRLLLQSEGEEIKDELITNPSLGSYKFRNGLTGDMKWLSKEILLSINRGIATCIFTYHYSAFSQTRRMQYRE